MHARDLIGGLSHLVGEAGVIRDPADQSPYLRDWLGRYEGRTPVVVRPRTTTEVAAVMRLCHQTGTPVVPQGGNTGMSGGATPDDSGAQVVLSLSRMTRIREVDPINNTLTVDAGVLLADVQRVAHEAQRHFPLSLGAEGQCTIGGNLATNAGGTSVLRYGNARELTLGLEVVLPDGRVWDGLRGLRKDNAGYDLKSLFIGSEGTLGIITGAVLKLSPLAPARAVAWVGALTPAHVVALLTHLQATFGQSVTAFEMMSAACLTIEATQRDDAPALLRGTHAYYALIELADTQDDDLAGRLRQALAQATQAGTIIDARVADDATCAAMMWRAREGISQAQVRGGKTIKHDIALPISRLAAFIDEADAAVAARFPQVRLINFGHVGDGNLHYNALLPLDIPEDDFAQLATALNRCVHDIVVQRGGTISAEHGVGQLRRDALRRYKSPVEMDLMLMIKRALDPNQLMNPGKVL
ncbi:FAD-binding oxidoreductase [Alcaligenaceae bacterium C4P045]|nr:FAD-binding oxidoreductase [Alcaligenaceae bacterium C4P045]